MAAKILELTEVKDYIRQSKKITVDPDGWVKRLRELHNKRLVNKLKVNNLNNDILRKALVVDQRTRSEIVGIYLDTEEILSSIGTMHEVLIMRIIATSTNLLPVKTKTEQKVYLNYIIGKKAPIVDKLKRAKETAKYILEDIDRASWNFKHQLESLGIASRHEGRVL